VGKETSSRAADVATGRRNSHFGCTAVANDTYVILMKRVNGQYSSISSLRGRQNADACVELLKIRKPGKYLLLNLRTKIVEEWKQSQAQGK
jgi:hypothetical protein